MQSRTATADVRAPGAERREVVRLDHVGQAKSDTTLIQYRDAEEGFHGYAAFNGHDRALAAGGFRVQPGLTAQTVVELAQTMTRKQRVLGLAVDGAKCGIDYDPHAPGKREAMRRFIRFLRPYLLERFSMGPDRGTTWNEIEQLAREEGIGSAKIAVAKAQGLSEEDFRRRSRLLSVPLGGLTLAQRLSGHALAHAVLSGVQCVGAGHRPVRVGVQGFGTLGRSCALSLLHAGLHVTALADEYGCRLATGGLDLGSLLAAPHASPVTRLSAGRLAPPEALFEAPVDVLVLAACEDAMRRHAAQSLPSSVRLVVVGANLGLSAAVERLLHDSSVVVVPDFVGGAGGSASMDVLFGSPEPPSPRQFLDHLAASMRTLVQQVLELSAQHHWTPRNAARMLADVRQPPPYARPYGHFASRALM